MSLYNALGIVHRDAQEQAKRHQTRLSEKPLSGWAQEKHDEYHIRYRDEALAVERYCFVRQMQINPD